MDFMNNIQSYQNTVETHFEEPRGQSLRGLGCLKRIVHCFWDMVRNV